MDEVACFMLYFVLSTLLWAGLTALVWTTPPSPALTPSSDTASHLLSHSFLAHLFFLSTLHSIYSIYIYSQGRYFMNCDFQDALPESYSCKVDEQVFYKMIVLLGHYAIYTGIYLPGVVVYCWIRYPSIFEEIKVKIVYSGVGVLVLVLAIVVLWLNSTGSAFHYCETYKGAKFMLKMSLHERAFYQAKHPARMIAIYLKLYTNVEELLYSKYSLDYMDMMVAAILFSFTYSPRMLPEMAELGLVPDAQTPPTCQYCDEHILQGERLVYEDYCRHCFHWDCLRSQYSVYSVDCQGCKKQYKAAEDCRDTFGLLDHAEVYLQVVKTLVRKNEGRRVGLFEFIRMRDQIVRSKRQEIYNAMHAQEEEENHHQQPQVEIEQPLLQNIEA